MKYNKIDNLGINVSLLGFGCMRFPTLSDGSIDEVETEKMVDKAIADGVNYIDTAYPYHGGKSEPMVGKIIKKYPRDSFYLATKLPLWAFSTKEEAYKIFYEQLKRLQTDYIDFYLLHAINKKRFDICKDLGIIEMCEELQREGKIKYLGFSFHDDYPVFEEIINYRKWDFCQLQLNYMDTETQQGIKGYYLAEKLGVPVIVMEPIKGGSLAKFPSDVEEIFLRANKDASMASWAMRYVGSLDNVKVILSGMSTYEQVLDNLKTFESFQKLSNFEQQVISDAVNKIKSRVKNNCTGCRYCMPCPYGVNIPEIFDIWNRQSMYDNYNVVSYDWSELKAEEKPNNCVECGACEAACPQHITIIEDLKEAYEKLKVLDNK